MDQWRLPLCAMGFTAGERAAVDAVLQSGWLTMGPRTAEFESAVADYLGVPHAFLVSSGTAALHLGILALDLDRSTPVIVPGITFVATANAATIAGHPILLCDVAASARPTMCPRQLRRLLGQHPRALVMPVHYAGYEAAIWEVMRDFPHASVVEDAAHAMGGVDARGHRLGSTRSAVAAGCRRAVSCFSFFSNKNLATGEGGLVVTHDESVAHRIRLLRSHGMNKMTWERHARVTSSHGPVDEIVGRDFAYEVETAGLNYRPTEIVACLATERLKTLDALNDRRRAILAMYRMQLTPLGVSLPFDANEDARSSGHLAPALFANAEDALRARAALTEARIQTSHHYPPLHRFQRFAGAKVVLPNAEAFSARELTLPLYPEMSDEDVASVVGVVAASLVPAGRA